MYHKNLDLVMPMYNIVEYSANYFETRFHSKGEATDFNGDIAITDGFKSFKYKAKLLENTEADGANVVLKNATIVVPLKYLSNFWRSLEMPLINYKIELTPKLTKYCVLSAAGGDNANNDSNNIIFTIKDTKL